LLLFLFEKLDTTVDGKKAESYISFHSINDLYHFKIIAFRKFEFLGGMKKPNDYSLDGGGPSRC
jgi:hypothetical protein